MGLKAWFSKRTISGLTHALCMNYRTVIRDNPALSTPDASKQALLKRYRILKLPKAHEIVLNLQLGNVETLKDACFTAVSVELQTSDGFPLNEDEVEQVITDILRKNGFE